MKKIFITLICLLMISTSAFSESIFSLGGGSFTPNDDVMSAFDTGFNATATYASQTNEIFGYGVDFALNQAEATNTIYGKEAKVTLTTFGVEALIYIQPKDAKIQPFAAAGIGAYANNLTGEYDGTEYYDESGSAVGFVGKAGLRLYFDNKFFISGYAKYYSNNQDFEHIDGSTESLNLGGTNFVLAVGVKL